MTIQFSKQKTNVGWFVFSGIGTCRSGSGEKPIESSDFGKPFFSWPFLVGYKLFEKGTRHAKPMFGVFFGAISLCLLLKYGGN